MLIPSASVTAGLRTEMKKPAHVYPLFAATVQNPYNGKVDTFIVRSVDATAAATEIREIASLEFHNRIPAEKVGPVSVVPESYITTHNAEPIRRMKDAWVF